MSQNSSDVDMAASTCDDAKRCEPAPQMTNFKRVLEFNRATGVLIGDRLTPNPNVADCTLESCMALIDEEVKELKEAVADRNFVEMIDALTDILYVTYGMGARLGVDMDDAFAAVHKNNMTKLCDTENEAIQSGLANTHAEICRSFKIRAVRNPNNTEGMIPLWAVFNADTGKILKPLNWKKVDLTDVCNGKS